MKANWRTIQDWLPLARQAGWSVQKLAALCKVPRRTLHRHFVNTQGMAPKAWLAKQRQKQAIELLRDGTPAKEAASLLGYQHPSTFAREFKKHSGQCPHALELQFQKRPLAEACLPKPANEPKG